MNAKDMGLLISGFPKDNISERPPGYLPKLVVFFNPETLYDCNWKSDSVSVWFPSTLSTVYKARQKTSKKFTKVGTDIFLNVKIQYDWNLSSDSICIWLLSTIKKQFLWNFQEIYNSMNSDIFKS